MPNPPTTPHVPGYQHWDCPFAPSDLPGPTHQKLTKVITKRLRQNLTKRVTHRLPRAKKKKFY